MAKRAVKAAPTPKETAIRALTSVADLQPDAQNANKGTARGRAMVEHSVRRYGFGRSVLADKQGRIIAGNKTLEVAGPLAPPVRVVQTTGNELVVVQRTDLDLDTDVAAKELAIADNRASELGLAWNVPTLEDLVRQGAHVDEFFRQQEWDRLTRGDDALPSGDEIPEMQLHAFEEYNYVVVVFRNSQDWTAACDLLALRKEAATYEKTRKVGLGRVLDGGKLVEHLQRCGSSFPREDAPAPSATKR